MNYKKMITKTEQENKTLKEIKQEYLKVTELQLIDEIKALQDTNKEQDKYFGILVNGKKATPNTKIEPSDEIVILPHIAGGF